ncbi:MAG TPA: tRNA (adenosine(37)-N6)-threonylcarbamoyltransferase complex dimerization subunit type 1 TsaB [Dehalococcoidia bacterium]|nr:tRNA (adenosine(37)-N6)-threonylcarbamoyltransferase complex dimerization subunit type 1 TsaB [Dehalococcoidia bacterium]
MAETAASLELAIDTAGPVSSVALTSEGALLAELTWRTRTNHSAELIPAIETVLAQAGREREQIRVLFVDRGPGAYAGLRVGISTAMGLALALNAELLAAGRLELDAYPHAASPGPICAIHQAGRGDLAWAVYATGSAAGLEELIAPRLSTLDELVDAAPSHALFCGELAGLEAALRGRLPAARFAGPAASLRRAAALAELGWQRYRAGARDNPLSVEPLYLREPAITRPKSAVAGTG